MFNIDYLYQICFITTIKGSVLIFIILGLQYFFKKDFTAKWVYTLWSIVIIRLLIPSFPLANTLSLYNFGIVKRLRFNVHNIVLGRLGMGSNNLDIINNKIPTVSFIKKAFSFNFEYCFAIIWLIIMIVLLLLFCLLNYRLHKIFLHSTLCTNNDLNQLLDECKSKLKSNRTVKLYITDDFTSPMTYGVISPKILIPRSIIEHFDSNELEYILLHELVHIKRFDVLFNLLGMLVCVIHWYNPIVWLFFLRSKRDCEMACDESVLDYLDGTDYRQYGLTLIQMLELSSLTDIKHTMISKSFINDRTEANIRITEISRYQKKSKYVIIFSVFWIIIIGLIGLNEDTCTRPTITDAKKPLYKYLDVSYNDVRTSFDKPIHTYAIRENNKSYFIIYYNIMGDKVQFWYDGADSERKKALEITSTGYMGIKQGMMIDDAKRIANKHFSFDSVEKDDEYTKHFYTNDNCNMMLLVDNEANKIYSITIY